MAYPTNCSHSPKCIHLHLATNDDDGDDGEDGDDEADDDRAWDAVALKRATDAGMDSEVSSLWQIALML